jgi:hypothetical protein
MSPAAPALPLILSNSFYDYVQNPQFLLTTAGDESGLTLPYQVGTNNRDLTSWSPGTPNVARYLTVDCLAPQTPTIAILDRGHNLAGYPVQFRGSPDGSTWTTVQSATIPTSTGALPTSANGCTTADGVWWIEFSAPASYRYWQLNIPAMGAGLVPVVTGLYLGVGYRYPQYLTANGSTTDWRKSVKYLKTSLSRRGVRVKSRPLVFREIQINLQVDDPDFLAFDAQVQSLLKLNAPWWFCLNDADPVLSGEMAPYWLPGDTTYDPQADPVHREIKLLLEEMIPRTYI